jgi:hypothetical protein
MLALILPIHDRMPVIVDPDNYDLWLDPGNAECGCGVRTFALRVCGGKKEERVTRASKLC